MAEEIERCSRCFTLKGKGFFKRLFLKRKLRAKGHLIFDEQVDKGSWTMVVSTRLYPNATFNERKK
jgi:hypothetical protein